MNSSEMKPIWNKMGWDFHSTRFSMIHEKGVI